MAQNNEEQKKLLIEMMEADAKDGLYKQQTSVEWLADKYIIDEALDLVSYYFNAVELNIKENTKVDTLNEIQKAEAIRIAIDWAMDTAEYQIENGLGNKEYWEAVLTELEWLQRFDPSEIKRS